jgi:hypothetical protein
MKLPGFERESFLQIVARRYCLAASWHVRRSKDF